MNHGQAMQERDRREAGKAWQDLNLVFCHQDGSMYTSEALNWRFSKMTRKAGIGHWHAHEGRHTAVSIMSTRLSQFYAFAISAGLGRV
jgi:integrase